MARKGSTGNIRVVFRESLADASAPTATELNLASTKDLTPNMSRDGLSTPNSGSTIDISDASTRQNKTGAGSYGGDPIEIKGIREDSEALDVIWTALYPGRTGYIIVRRFGGSTATFASTQNVEVYPVEVISRENAPIADNEKQSCNVRLAVTGAVYDDAYIGGAS